MSAIGPRDAGRGLPLPADDAGDVTRGTAGGARPGFDGFPPPSGAGFVDARRGAVWLASDGPRQTVTMTARDLSASLFRRLSSGKDAFELEEGRGLYKGVMGELVEALGGPDAARKVGIREVKNAGNAFGLRPGKDYEIDVEVDSRLTAEDLDGVSGSDVLVVPLSAKIGRALRDRGVGTMQKSGGHVYGGIQLSASDGRAFLTLHRSDVREVTGLRTI